MVEAWLGDPESEGAFFGRSTVGALLKALGVKILTSLQGAAPALVWLGQAMQTGGVGEKELQRLITLFVIDATSPGATAAGVSARGLQALLKFEASVLELQRPKPLSFEWQNSEPLLYVEVASRMASEQCGLLCEALAEQFVKRFPEWLAVNADFVRVAMKQNMRASSQCAPSTGFSRFHPSSHRSMSGSSYVTST